MKRALFRLSGVLSLVLFLAATTAWVRSYWVEDQVEWLRDTPGTTQWLRQIYDCYSSRGGLRLSRIRSLGTDRSNIESFRADAKIQPIFKHEHFPARSFPALDMVPPTASIWRMLGFGFDASDIGLDRPSNVWRDQLVFPDWFAVIVLALPAVLVLRSERRTYLRGKLGLCPTCGYDLRATPERCPECGTVCTIPK